MRCRVIGVLLICLLLLPSGAFLPAIAHTPLEGASSFNVLLHPGWNLLSSPLEAAKSAAELFAALDPSYLLFAYCPITGGYLGKGQISMLEAGRGYWLKLSATPSSVSLIGEAWKAHEVHLLEGWNMIGSPDTQPVAWEDLQVRNRSTSEVVSLSKGISTIAGYAWLRSSFFAYDGDRYQDIQGQDLTPGVGYWVKVNPGFDLDLIFPVRQAIVGGTIRAFGQPLAGATLTLRAGSQLLASATSGSDGSYQATVPLSEPALLTIALSCQLPVSPETIWEEERAVTAEPGLTYQVDFNSRHVQVEGQVSAFSQPAPGGMVSLRWGAISLGSAIIDNNGHFSAVFWLEEPSPITVSLDTTTLTDPPIHWLEEKEIACQPGHCYTLSFLPPYAIAQGSATFDGVPAVGASVTIFRGEVLVATTAVQADGRYRCAIPLPQAALLRYRLEYPAAPWVQEWLVDTSPNEIRQVDFSALLVSLQGYLSYCGEPAIGARLEFFEEGNFLSAVTTGPDGRYRCSFELAHQATLTASLTYSPSSPSSVWHEERTLSATPAGSYSMDFSAPFASVKGSVSFFLEPAVEAQLQIMKEGELLATAQTGEDGKYRCIVPLTTPTTLSVSLSYLAPTDPPLLWETQNSLSLVPNTNITLDFPSSFVRVEGFAGFFDQPASGASVRILEDSTQLAAATTSPDGRYTCTFILEESKTLTVDLTYATPTSPPYTKHRQQSLQASPGTFIVDFPSNFIIVEGTITYSEAPAAGTELGFYLDGHTIGSATADAAGFYRRVFELDQDGVLAVEMIYTIPSPPGMPPIFWSETKNVDVFRNNVYTVNFSHS